MRAGPDILERIFEKKRIRVLDRMSSVPLEELAARAGRSAAASDANRFASAFRSRSSVNVIAEIKRASPSKGVINPVVDVAKRAADYEAGGASAVSVLTEEEHFLGSAEDLRIARASTSLPILRKDFVFHEFQLFESVLIGADAILLIAGMLGEAELSGLIALAKDLKLDVLFEVHDRREMKTAASLGADIIGINNRDLRTFEVRLDTSRELIGEIPDGAIAISESGLRRKEDLFELRDLGFDGFLIGEHLMRESGSSLLRELRGTAPRKGSNTA